MHFLLALIHFISGILIINQSSHSVFRDFCLESVLASGQYVTLWIIFHFLLRCDIETKKYVCFVQIVLWTLILTPLSLYLIVYNNEWEIHETPLLIFFECTTFMLLMSCIILFVFMILQCNKLS